MPSDTEILIKIEEARREAIKWVELVGMSVKFSPKIPPTDLKAVNSKSKEKKRNKDDNVPDDFVNSDFAADIQEDIAISSMGGDSTDSMPTLSASCPFVIYTDEESKKHHIKKSTYFWQASESSSPRQ